MTKPTEMELVIGAEGDARSRCSYDEAMDLRAFGKLQITWANHVKPDLDGNWWANVEPVAGPALGPFRRVGGGASVVEGE